MYAWCMQTGALDWEEQQRLGWMAGRVGPGGQETEREPYGEGCVSMVDWHVKESDMVTAGFFMAGAAAVLEKKKIEGLSPIYLLSIIY